MVNLSSPLPVRYVIVQAGGKGSRLEHYCWNKPKCLVPINGTPMLYALFENFDVATTFIVIGSHHFEVLERVLKTFPPRHRVQLVRGSVPGTIDGLAAATALLPDDVTPFLLVWSDIYFEESPQAIMDAPDDEVTVGLTRSFSCRWRMGTENQLEEVATSTEGVFGLFKIPDRTWLAGLPASGGEFVRWLAQCRQPMRRQYFDRIKEYGTLEALHSCWAESSYCRFFNEISFVGDTVVKRAKFDSHAGMIADELAWYGFVQERGFSHVPKVLSGDPLTLERVRGQHPFDLPSGFKSRRLVLERIFDSLAELHRLVPAQPADGADAKKVYFDKTMQRLENFRSLAPEFAGRPAINVNGAPCRNPLHPEHQAWFESLVRSVAPASFTVIHGDPTFSNTLVTDQADVKFIDPRGRFGLSQIFGDPMYDWAKLYYSVVGGYDQFNRRQFLLSLDQGEVELSIRQSGWNHLGGLFEARFAPAELRQIRILHALIWFGLSGYVQDDYDSILGAFFKGIHELNHVDAI